MTAVPELSDERLAALVERTRQQFPAAEVEVEPPVEVEVPAGEPPVEVHPEPPVPFSHRVKRRLKREVRTRLVPVAAPLIDRVTRRVARDLLAQSPELTARVVQAVVDGSMASTLDAPLAELRGEHAVLRAQHDAARRELARLTAIADEVHALMVNSELLKAQVLAVHGEIERLGWAIAPGAGIGAAGERLAELRLRLNELDRRVRLLADAAVRAYRTGAPEAPDAQAAPGDASTAIEPASAVAGVAGFDYSGFEYRFRGEPERVASMLFDRYGELLAEHQPVLDVGCGRGELLERLVAAGVEARGVELDGAMADAARARGVDVVHGDALEHLQTLPAGSLGAIVSIHVVEHLPLDSLLALFELARDRLRPGGVLVLETPNPASLIVLGNSYVMDPTHVRPLHPSLLTFLAESAGFDDVRLQFYEPATGYHLPRLPIADDTPEWVRTLDEGIARLNEVLFGAQEYALVARTARADASR